MTSYGIIRVYLELKHSRMSFTNAIGSSSGMLVDDLSSLLAVPVQNPSFKS
jgi:hypothetical protein